MKFFLFISLLFSAIISAYGQTELIPLVSLKTEGLIGGVKDKKWIGYEQAKSALTEKKSYEIYDLQGNNISALTVKEIDSDARCEGFGQISFEKKTPETGIAFGGKPNWNPVPRKISFLGVNLRIYQKEIADELRKNNLSKSSVKITQIVKTDLDNDGKDEIILSAMNLKQGLIGRADVGDYSFLMVRKIVNGKVKSFVLQGDFINRATVAKNTESYFAFANEYRVSSIADLNGDGVMEILVFANYYHGEWVSVFEFKNNKFIEVKELSVGCE